MLAGLLDEVEIGIRIVEILGNGGIGAGLHLTSKLLDVILRRACLRMRFSADELDQFIGIAKLARRQIDSTIATWQITAQSHQAPDAMCLVIVENCPQGSA